MNAKSLIPSLICILILSACNFSTSLPKDGSKGISILENGMSAGKVYLTDGQEETDRRSFYYGQKIYTNFEGLTGFDTKDGKFYPEMHMSVLSKAGDTIMNNQNMFGADKKGFDDEVLTVNGNVILARPIYSDQEYVLHYIISDAKGEAKMTTKMDFEVLRNPAIKVKSSGLTHTEAYIFSEDKNEVLQDGIFNFYENLRFDFQDLDGYTKKDGAIHIGMSVNVIDDNGDVILNQPDVFNEPIYDEELLKQGISATLVINEGRVANPLSWQIKIWDKNSNAELLANAQISVKN